MTRTLRRAVTGLICATAVVAASAAASAGAPASPAPAPSGPQTAKVCDEARAGYARCLALVRTDAAAQAASKAAATKAAARMGYGATDLRAAYGVSASTARPWVAVVIAFDVPNAEADLAFYRSTYGLPACTTANGCFRKVNQGGATSPLPPPDGGWALEGSMDLQMVSAACPSCRILLVEANDNMLTNMAKATATAARKGAKIASHSYGADEGGWMSQVSAPYQNPAMPSVASSGDYGFTTAGFPAVLAEVTAVGGTTLTPSTNARGWQESVWSGAGSGCSAWVNKPAYQNDPNCQMRTVADVAAVADPATGVAVYDTYPNPFTAPGWVTLGGTSASAPFVAGLIGAAGSPALWRSRMAYSRAARFNDVVGGSNGSCGEDYLCTGLAGYDAPTGVGTPRGLWPFRKN